MNYLFDVNTLREYTGRYDINNTIQQLRRKISLSPGVVILTESAKSKLNDLAQSGLSDIKFYQYVEILADNITNINLEHLAKQLLDVSTELPKGQDDIRASLEKNALDLAYYHEHLVKPMAMLSEQLAAKAVTLEEKIKFNHSSMAEAIHNLVDEVTKAQKFLNEDGPEYVQQVSFEQESLLKLTYRRSIFSGRYCRIVYFIMDLIFKFESSGFDALLILQLATKFGNAFLRQVDDFLERVIDHALFHVGKCTPVSNAYNATLVAGCSKILDPFVSD